MFRTVLVRPSSGWIPQSEVIYNCAIQPLKSGGRDLVYKNVACAQAICINIYIVYISLWNIFVHIWYTCVNKIPSA